MTNINESNVDQLKSEHECDEHWELRRKFLLAHKDKFSQDELICLAQVFTNVEFLGCKYPKETMKMISKLSSEVVEDYRDRQKSRLKRTFVGASDAASSKAKGQSKIEKPVNSDNSESSCTKRERNYANFKRNIAFSLSTTDTQPETKKTKIKEKSNPHISKDIIMFEYSNDTPQTIVSRIGSINNDLKWELQKSQDGINCVITLNNNILANVTGPTKKGTRKAAALKALEELRKKYYTIKVTMSLTPTIDDISSETETKANSNTLANDNIGLKMMKLMGWSGGGLGKESQGITEPVSVQQQMTRKGLGLKDGMYNMKTFKKKCTEVLQNYVRSNETTDMVFSPNFTNEERGTIHQIAKRLGLKSQSYGPKRNRILTISRKISPEDLLQDLIELGGTTEKYQLIEPTGE